MREKKMRAKLEDFLQEVCEKTITNNQYPVLTSSKSGLFLQSDYFNKQVASKDNTGYKIIRRGQFTYRAMSDTGEFFPNMLECADVGIVSPAYPVFEIIKQDQIVPEYLNYYFKSNRFQNSISTFAQGSTRTSVKFGKLKKVSIELPEIKKQYQIIRTLDLLRTIINNRKKEVLELDELIRARFVELFGDQTTNPYGWQKASIGACCTLKSGTSLPADKENEGGAIPYVKVSDMNYPGNEQYITTSSRFVSEQTAGTGVFPVGTVVFPKRGGAIGTNKKRLTRIPICADLNVMGVTAGIRLTPQYLMAYFSNIDLGTLNNGSSVPQINNKDIAPLLICLPPMVLQQQFAEFVTQVDKSKATVQKALDETQLLFDSLMQQYFG